MIVTQHEGAWVALLETYRDLDRVTDCDVTVIDLSLTLIEILRGQLALAQRLKAEHDIAHVAWWDYTPRFYAGNYTEADAHDHIPDPQWTEEARLDAVQLHANDDSLWWEGSHHYADVPISTEQLTAADLDTMTEALASDKGEP